MDGRREGRADSEPVTGCHELEVRCRRLEGAVRTLAHPGHSLPTDNAALAAICKEEEYDERPVCESGRDLPGTIEAV